MPTDLTGRTAELILRAALGNPMTTPMYEGWAVGNTQNLVHGIAVCYTPTLDLLRRAAAEHRTLIVSREHPFFLHGGLHYSYGTDGLADAMRDDPVVRAKREVAATNQLMVYRCSGLWDQFRPKAQSEALAAALGLKPLASPPTDRARGVVCDVPRTTLAALAAKVSARRPRVVGDPANPVTRVAVLAGETDPTPALAKLLADPKIDGIVTGAGGVVDEVDGAIGYFQDMVGSGRRIAMLAIGHGPSHYPGVAEMARYLKTVFPEQSVEYWPVPDPAWIPGVTRSN